MCVFFPVCHNFTIIFVATLVTNIELLKTEVVKLKNEKVDIEKKIALLEEELKVIGRENILLNQHIMVGIFV